VLGKSVARWSARFDAAKALVKDYDEIVDALESIMDDDTGDQKADTRQEATGLYELMQRLETRIMSVFWETVLSRFQASSVSLQSAYQSLNSVVVIYDSLETCVQSLRDRFEEFEAHGKELSRCDSYQADLGKRVRRRNRKHDEPDAEPEVQLSPRDKFRVGTFTIIIDNLLCEPIWQTDLHSSGKFHRFPTHKLERQQVSWSLVTLQICNRNWWKN
jgi:hypothetical protein